MRLLRCCEVIAGLFEELAKLGSYTRLPFENSSQSLPYLALDPGQAEAKLKTMACLDQVRLELLKHPFSSPIQMLSRLTSLLSASTSENPGEARDQQRNDDRHCCLLGKMVSLGSLAVNSFILTSHRQEDVGSLTPSESLGLTTCVRAFDYRLGCV